MISISRRKIVNYITHQIINENKNAIQELAAFLIHENQIKFIDLYINDINKRLVDFGLINVEVISSHQLDNELKNYLEEYSNKLFNAKKVFLSYTIEPEVIGGLKLKFPESELDLSVSNLINKFKTSKV